MSSHSKSSDSIMAENGPICWGTAVAWQQRAGVVKLFLEPGEKSRNWGSSGWVGQVAYRQDNLFPNTFYELKKTVNELKRI